MEGRKAIVILQRGFVWVGEVYTDPTNSLFFVLKKGATVRRWGTSKGLGQLAAEGPKSNTVLDLHETESRFTLLSYIGEIECGPAWDKWFAKREDA